MQESSCPQNHTSLCDGFNILHPLMCDGDFPWMRKNVFYIIVTYCVESVNVCLWTFVLHLGCHVHHFLRDFCCSLLSLFEYLLKNKQKNLTLTYCSYWHTIFLCSYMVCITLWMTPQYHSLNVHNYNNNNYYYYYYYWLQLDIHPVAVVI
jgi:hypothetical protein